MHDCPCCQVPSLPASINATGDIVTYANREYRYRGGLYYVREGGGELVKTEWRALPQAVRNAYVEKTFGV